MLSARFLTRIAPVATVVVLFELLFAWSSPVLCEFDAYYHVGLAQLYAERGLVRTFPWMSLSVLADGFNDPQLLLHLLLLPLLKLGIAPLVAGKVLAMLLAIAFVVALYAFLLRWQVPQAAVFTIATMLGSPYLVARLSFLKSTGLFLVGLLVFCDALFAVDGPATPRRVKIQLFVVAWLSVYAYQGYPLLLFFALLWAGALAATGGLERWDWRLVGWIAGGLAVGLVVNPFFPHDLSFFTFEIVEQILMRPKEVVLGAEWGSIDSAQLGSSVALGAVALFGGSLLSGWAGLRWSAEQLFFRIIAGLLLFGAMLSARLIDYFVPFAILCAAFDLRALHRAGHALPTVFLYGALIVGVPLCGANVRGAQRLVRSMGEHLRVDEYRAIGEALEKASPEGELVVAQWDDFPLLFFYNRHNRYAYGLSPMYGYGYSQPLYTAHQLLFEGRIRDPETLLQRLNARLIVVSRIKDYPGRRVLYDALRASPAFEQIAAVGDLFVFRLRGP